MVRRSLIALAFASSAAFAEEPRLLPNGWYAGEIGNSCMAARELADGSRLFIRLMKWNDHSDSVILWRPNLPPLMSEGEYSTGLTVEEEEAEAADNFRLTVTVDGGEIGPALGHYQLIDFEGKAGPSYRLGIAQAEFLDALRGGRVVEIRRRGDLIAAFPIEGSAAMAGEMAECVNKPIA